MTDVAGRIERGMRTAQSAEDGSADAAVARTRARSEIARDRTPSPGTLQSRVPNDVTATQKKSQKRGSPASLAAIAAVED